MVDGKSDLRIVYSKCDYGIIVKTDSRSGYENKAL